MILLVLADFENKTISVRKGTPYHEVGRTSTFNGKTLGMTYAMINVDERYGFESAKRIWANHKYNPNFLNKLNGYVEDLILNEKRVSELLKKEMDSRIERSNIVTERLASFLMERYGL